jgi:hypothetical protein
MLRTRTIGPDIPWLLEIDDVVTTSGKTGPDGKVPYTLPVGTSSAYIYFWNTPPVTHNLPTDNKGTKESVTIPEQGSANPQKYARWELQVTVEKLLAESRTGADGKAKFTLPANTHKAVIQVWDPNDFPEGIPYSAGAQMIYPHSKLMVVDDTWAIVGSANANGKSFVTDEEISIVYHDREKATKLRDELFFEHLGVHLNTRDIRKFFEQWDTKAHPKVDDPGDCDPNAVQTVHAVKLGDVDPGQKYDGPLSSVMNMDKQA